MSEESKLKKVLGLSDVISVAFGQTIGAGVIVLTGVAIGMTGTGIVPGYFIAALAVLVGTLPIAVLGSTIPATGGLYQYASRLWSPKTGFFYLLLIIPAKLTLAMYALTFAQYFKSIVPDVSGQWVAAGVLTLMYVVNLLGVKVAANILKLMLACLVIALGLFIWYGVPEVHLEVFTADNFFSHGMLAFLSATALLSFATGGSVFISELGGEMKNPKRDIPLAIVTATLCVGVLYSAIGFVASGVLPIPQVAGKPLSEVAKVILPHNLFLFFLIGGALLSVGKMLLLAFTWGPKALLMGSVHGWLPKGLGKVSSRFGTPYVLQTIMYVIGMIPILTGASIATIAKLATSVSTLGFCFAITGSYFLPDKFPELFKTAVFSFSPKGFKRLVVVSSIIMIGQAVLLIAGLQVEIIVSVVVYFALAGAWVWKTPNREIDFEDTAYKA